MLSLNFQKINGIAYFKNVFYSLIDTFAEYRQMSSLDTSITGLKEYNFFVIISGPDSALVHELLKIASQYGVRTEDISSLSHCRAYKLLNDLLVRHNKSLSGLTLVYTTLDPDSFSTLPKECIKVLVLPPIKKIIKSMRREKKSREDLLQTTQQYEFFSKQTCYDIILNEFELPKQTLNTFVYKLQNIIKLRQFHKEQYPPGAYDIECFVIWGHGLKYKKEIINEIKEKFTVLAIVDKKISNLKKFVREMYIEEVLKIGHHILKKNRHLAESPRYATMVLVKVVEKDKSFDCKGHGIAGNICSTYSQHFKQNLRDRYNPKKQTGERTEYHVIHTADTPVQTDNVLRMFDLKSLVKWINNE